MRTILYSVSKGYIARNLLRTGVIEKLLEHKDIRIVILTPGYDDEDFVRELSFNDRIFIEKMYKVDRSYDFVDKVIWKSWLLGYNSILFQKLYKLFMNLQIQKRYYSKLHHLYKETFDKYKPDLVVGGSIGVYSRGDIPVYAEAKKRKIKTLVFIHSWDNITKRKGPIWFRPDILGVWNESQKQDAIDTHFYDERDLRLVGPAHFDIYWRKNTFMTREDFFKKMGLDPAKKLVTMIATCPGLVNNSYIVDILLDALRKNKFVFPVQLVCRPTPSIDSKRNEQEFGRFFNSPDIVIDHQVQQTSSLGWNPDQAQLYHFANLVKHTDVQVSIISTATIEAAILDRPAVNVAFSTSQPELFKKFIIDSVFTHHFKTVIDSGATYLARNPADLIAGINQYLLNPGLHREERERLKYTLVYKTDGKATERITQTILEILNSIRS